MKKSISIPKIILAVLFIGILSSVAAVVFLYFTNESVAREIRQVRLSKPNRFFVGIDVSSSISEDTLFDLEDTLVSRLEKFVGEETVSYIISIFGLPGCGEDAMAGVVAAKSPADLTEFTRKVESPLRAISIVQHTDRKGSRGPLTTPLYLFLKRTFETHAGERVIIFSDLVNDDRGCPELSWFPMDQALDFGADKSSLILFFYPDLSSAYHAGDKKEARQQRNFVRAIEKLREEGKMRAFLYPIPTDPARRKAFLNEKLQEAIPETVIEVLVERFSKVVDTIVGAVRG